MSPPLKYVVLRHEGVDKPHFDLMFETHPSSDLATWRTNEWPVTPTTQFIPLRPHRRAYLQFEGVLSNNRGTVHQIHAGHHHILQDTPEFLRVRLDSGEHSVFFKARENKEAQ